jgi:hypothetical protein
MRGGYRADDDDDGEGEPRASPARMAGAPPSLLEPGLSLAECERRRAALPMLFEPGSSLAECLMEWPDIPPEELDEYVSEQPSSSTWANCSTSTFRVRCGPNYKSTRRKAPSAFQLYEVRARFRPIAARSPAALRLQLYCAAAAAAIAAALHQPAAVAAPRPTPDPASRDVPSTRRSLWTRSIASTSCRTLRGLLRCLMTQTRRQSRAACLRI